LIGHVGRITPFPDQDQSPNNVADAPLALLTIGDSGVLDTRRS
jgi:hypothetical protein